jgi:hypothetical protein
MAIGKRVIRTIVAGKKEPLERVVYPVYNKETGEEKILIHGIDAREHIRSGAWSSVPKTGNPITLQVIHQDADANVVESPIVPTVDEMENESKVAQTEAASSGNKRTRKTSPAAEED